MANNKGKSDQSELVELSTFVKNLSGVLIQFGEAIHPSPVFRCSIPVAKDLKVSETGEMGMFLETDYDDLEPDQIESWVRCHLYSVYHIGSVQPRLHAYRYGAMNALCEYAIESSEKLREHRFLLAYSSLRGLIETVAQFITVADEVKNYINSHSFPDKSLSTDDDIYDSYRRYLIDLGTSVHKHTQASRFAWGRAAAADTYLMTEKQRRKKTPSELAHGASESISIMSYIDSIDKLIPGSRSVYELLCDFVHPNSPQRAIFMDIATTRKAEDLGMMVLDFGSSGTGEKFYNDANWSMNLDILECVARMLQVFTQRDSELVKALNALDKHVKQYVRRSIKHYSLFSSTDPCPCGSSKKISMCCGKKLKSKMMEEDSRKEFMSRDVTQRSG